MWLQSAEDLKADRHAWMINHDTGEILHDEISKRALAKVSEEFAEAEKVIADEKLHEFRKTHYRAVIAQGVEARWQRQIEVMTASAKHIACQWRAAHGDLSDSRVMSESEMKGLSSDHWVSP
ncbi:MAG: hypothetical protein Q8M31_21875 [Beijerinckiaceae bacterium]|nr:hypothetical protein [Beijerinckiaceae bacterium]